MRGEKVMGEQVYLGESLAGAKNNSTVSTLALERN